MNDNKKVLIQAAKAEQAEAEAAVVEASNEVSGHFADGLPVSDSVVQAALERMDKARTVAARCERFARQIAEG